MVILKVQKQHNLKALTPQDTKYLSEFIIYPYSSTLRWHLPPFHIALRSQNLLAKATLFSGPSTDADNSNQCLKVISKCKQKV